MRKWELVIYCNPFFTGHLLNLNINPSHNNLLNTFSFIFDLSTQIYEVLNTSLNCVLTIFALSSNYRPGYTVGISFFKTYFSMCIFMCLCEMCPKHCVCVCVSVCTSQVSPPSSLSLSTSAWVSEGYSVISHSTEESLG